MTTKTTPDIEQIMADNVLRALALSGVTPDRNTQSKAEVAETEKEIQAAVRRSLPLAAS